MRNAASLAPADRLLPPALRRLRHGPRRGLGDLGQEAARTDAPLVVFCGVHFMAETAAMLSPQKTVLIPDLEAGCSLAASVTHSPRPLELALALSARPGTTSSGVAIWGALPASRIDACAPASAPSELSTSLSPARNPLCKYLIYLFFFVRLRVRIQEGPPASY